MAKKKTAPVLRAESGGEQPTPETPIITKSYSVRDDWKDKDIVNYVAFKSVDGEVQDLTVNGEPAGGGGGGGISTARVSITNNLSGNLEIVSPGYFFNDDTNKEFTTGDYITISRGSTNTVFVALAANGGIINVISQFNNMNCSGETEPDGSSIMVYGDGSVIFS